MAESHFTSLKGFTLVKTLALLKDSNTVVLLCTFREENAVVMISNKLWTDETAAKLFTEDASVDLRLEVNNAEYYDFSSCFANDKKVSVQWPAKQYHIDKWKQSQVWFVRETPELYATATLPYIDAIPESKNKWIQNIFDGSKEADRVLFKDEEMVIVFDTKMDMADLSSVYMQCIFREAGIRSIRDLRAEHLPMLQRARTTILKVSREKLSCKPSELRIYMHYYPTFWWAHIHVQHISFPMMGGSTSIGKAILLEDVMQNLALKSDYYACATLVSIIKEGTPHHAAFVKANANLDENQ